MGLCMPFEYDITKDVKSLNRRCNTYTLGRFRPRRHTLRWTDVLTLGSSRERVEWRFASVDAKARKPAASTHLARWVHPSDRGWDSFCFAVLQTAKPLDAGRACGHPSARSKLSSRTHGTLSQAFAASGRPQARSLTYYANRGNYESTCGVLCSHYLFKHAVNSLPGSPLLRGGQP